MCLGVAAVYSDVAFVYLGVRGLRRGCFRGCVCRHVCFAPIADGLCELSCEVCEQFFVFVECFVE